MIIMMIMMIMIIIKMIRIMIIMKMIIIIITAIFLANCESTVSVRISWKLQFYHKKAFILFTFSSKFKKIFSLKHISNAYIYCTISSRILRTSPISARKLAWVQMMVMLSKLAEILCYLGDII